MHDTQQHFLQCFCCQTCCETILLGKPAFATMVPSLPETSQDRRWERAPDLGVIFIWSCGDDIFGDHCCKINQLSRRQLVTLYSSLALYCPRNIRSVLLPGMQTDIYTFDIQTS